MNRYFQQFPVINYNGDSVINIMSRTAILNSVLGDNYAFYPYQVKNGMRAEVVAEKYYGDQNLVWLVYFSNNIIDPYYQWPMSDLVLNRSIIAKYGSLEAANEKVAFYRVNWYEDTTELTPAAYRALDPTLKKYWGPELDQYNNASSYVRKQIDHQVVAQDGNGEIIALPITGLEAQYWSPVTCYDVEIEDNARKSSIRLLDSRLSQTAIANLKELLAQ